MSVKVITVGEDILSANEEKSRQNKKLLSTEQIDCMTNGKKDRQVYMLVQTNNMD